MKFLRKIAGFLGFNKDEGHEKDKDDDADHTIISDNSRINQGFGDPIPGTHRKGFSVPVQVAVDRPVMGPVLGPCANGDGGVQGLRWYTKRLRIDEDGDVADEFLHEVLSEVSPVMHDEPKPFPRFQVKHNAKPANVINSAISSEGKFVQYVQCQGRLQLV